MATKTKTQPIIIILYPSFKNNYMLGFFFGRHFSLRLYCRIFIYRYCIMSTANSFQGFVDKLICYDNEVKACYIGSTKNLKARMREHRSNTNCKSRKEHNSVLCETIRNTGGWNNWTYQVLGSMRVNNYSELHKFESLYIKSTKNTLNKSIPSRTRKEYYEEEKKSILAYKKSYHQNNRIKLAKKRKEKYDKNKEYYRIKAKAYYDINKSKIKERRAEKLLWFDGTETSKSSSRFRHLKSKNHK